MTTLTAMDTQPAFREGYQAYKRGELANANPYWGYEFTWWQAGWITAECEAGELMNQLEMNAAGAAPDVIL